MPLYATRCTTCDHRKDILVPTTSSPLPRCTCGGDLERTVSAPGQFTITGPGVYKPGTSTRR